jgi:hypothetical protein
MGLRLFFSRGKPRRWEATAEEFLASARQPDASGELRDHGFQRVMSRVVAREPSPELVIPHPRKRFPVYAALRAAAVAVVALLIIGGSTAALYAASYQALPDSWLYGVKTAFEKARAALAFSPSSGLELELEFSQRRLEEIREMVRVGSTRGGDRWLAEYGSGLRRMERRLASLRGEEERAWRDRLSRHLEEQEEDLATFLDGSPAGLAHLLEEARSQCAVHRQRMRQGGSEGSAPGGCGAGGPGGSSPEGGTAPGGDGKETNSPYPSGDGEGSPSLERGPQGGSKIREDTRFGFNAAE